MCVHRSRSVAAFIYAALFVVGAAIDLHYGRLGYMPLDSSIVFDGAWRTMNGQVPYRDYVTPSGIVPILIQALFFKVLGVTWFAYCLHAALFNGLFCILVYWLLRELETPASIAVLCGLFSAVAYYTPIGTPYLEQHSFFFVLMTTCLALAAMRAAGCNRAPVFWFFVPWTGAAAVLSKHLPGISAAPIVLGLLATTSRDQLSIAVRWMCAGFLVLIAICGLAIGALRISPADMILYLYRLPLNVGGARVALHNQSRFFNAWQLISPTLVYAVVSILLVGLAPTIRRGSVLIVQLWLAFSFLASCSVFVALTSNEPENGVPYLFCSIGLVISAVLSVSGLPHTKRQVLAQIGRFRLRDAVGMLIALILAGAAAIDAHRFVKYVDRTRLVNNQVFRPPADRDQRELPAPLSFMEWSKPDYYSTAPRDLRTAAGWLSASHDRFVLVGDDLILYALAGKPSTFPALWFHPG
jgi:hypothetical protein